MLRRVEQIEPVRLARLALIAHRYWMRLDSDPALPLQIHRIEQLVLLLAFVNGAGPLQQSVR